MLLVIQDILQRLKLKDGFWIWLFNNGLMAFTIVKLSLQLSQD